MLYDRAQVEAFISGFEGTRFKAYYDIVGRLTIGIGHRIIPADNMTINTTIVQTKVDQLFTYDIDRFVRSLTSLIKYPDLTANQNCALLGFEFNLGSGALASSTLLSRLNKGDLVGASKQFGKWDHAMVNGSMVEVPSLQARRREEFMLFTRDFASQGIGA